MKTAIVTDSSAYLSRAECDKYHITVIPLLINMDGKSYREGIDIDNQTFYRKLKASTTLPSTSESPTGMIIKTYNKLAAEGYDNVISIHLASTISGMYRQICAIAPTIKNIKVIPYDSHITVRLMGDLAIVAARMAHAGKSVKDILKRLDDLRSTIDEVFVVDDLKNLVKGGRLSNASGFIGSLLRIKPLLTFDNKTDKIVAFQKIRSRKRALKRTEQIFAEKVKAADYPIRAIVFNANDPQGGNFRAKHIQSMYPDMKIEQSFFGPAIGTHLGAKALALGWIKDFDKDWHDRWLFPAYI